MKIINKKNRKEDRGFVMLFSVLIASLLVAVGLSIFNITLKELTISTADRESQIAFYAASSGLECALYWDLQKDAFVSNNTKEQSDKVGSLNPSPMCGIAFFNNIKASNAKSATTELTFDITNDFNPPCAVVTIEKSTDSSVTPPVETTTIKSQGTNICGNGSGRKVQRGLQATITR